MEKLMPRFGEERIFEVRDSRVGGEIIGTKLPTSNEKRRFARGNGKPEAEVLGFGKGILVYEKRIRVDGRFL